MFLPHTPIDMTDMPEMSGEVLAFEEPGAVDPSLLSVLDDLAGRNAASSLEAGFASSSVPFDNMFSPAGHVVNPTPVLPTLTPLTQAALATCDGSASFFNLGRTLEQADAATAVTNNTISANSSLDSLFDLSQMSSTTPTPPTTAETSTKRKASTPVSNALYAMSSTAPLPIGEKSYLQTGISPVTPDANRSLVSDCPTAYMSASVAPGKQAVTPVPFPTYLINSGSSASVSRSSGLITTNSNQNHSSCHPVPSAGGAARSTAPASRAVSRTSSVTLPARRYKIMQPSKFCHICVRSGELVNLAPCANVLSGVCRKAICRKCFDKHGHGGDWSVATDNKALLDAERVSAASTGAPARPLGPQAWTCLHCRKICPPSAQCKIYARTNRRRHLLLKQRKADKAAFSNGLPSSHGVRKPARSRGTTPRPQPQAPQSYMSVVAMQYAPLPPHVPPSIQQHVNNGVQQGNLY